VVIVTGKISWEGGRTGGARYNLKNAAMKKTTIRIFLGPWQKKEGKGNTLAAGP